MEDPDSGIDSLQEEVTENEQSKEYIIQSDEMQVVYLYHSCSGTKKRSL